MREFENYWQLSKFVDYFSLFTFHGGLEDHIFSIRVGQVWCFLRCSWFAVLFKLLIFEQCSSDCFIFGRLLRVFETGTFFSFEDSRYVPFGQLCAAIFSFFLKERQIENFGFSTVVHFNY